MIRLRLRQSLTVNAQKEVFEQNLAALQVEVVDYFQYHDTGIIEYTLKGSSKKLSLKVVSLANTLFYPYLLGVGVLAYSPDAPTLEVIPPIW